MELPERNAVIVASMALAAGPDIDLSASALLTALEDLAGSPNPFPVAIANECAAIRMRASEMVVGNHDQAAAMGELVIQASTMSKTIEARRKGFTVFFDNAKSAVMGWVKPYTTDLDEAVAIGKRKLAAYQEAERKKAAEAQAALERKAAEERRRIAEQAAAVEAKARADAAELQRKADEARAAGDAQKAAALETRAELKAEASAAKVAELETQAAMTSAPTIQAEAPKVAGISGREKWVVDVTNRGQLLAFLASSQQHSNLLQIDMGGLNRLANVFKDGFSMPGCTARRETVIAARAMP